MQIGGFFRQALKVECKWNWQLSYVGTTQGQKKNGYSIGVPFLWPPVLLAYLGNADGQLITSCRL